MHIRQTRLRLFRGLRFLSAGLGLTMLGMPGATAQSVTLTSNHSNAVSYWNQVANKTVLARSDVAITPEERRPLFSADIASVHLAIYDTAVAIEGRFEPFAIKPVATARGASLEAAITAAAYGVLKALYPNRSTQYQGAYDQRLAAIPDGEAKTLGLALGSEVAAGIVKLRSDDGRSVALAPYVSGTAAGKFRSPDAMPILRHLPSVKPFSLDRLDQFRPAAPPGLNSAAYTAAVEETRTLGGSGSAARTPEQLEIARFHTEAPPVAVTRNLGRFASSTADVGDAARLMAMIYVSFADALGACFEAKYHYEAWRPISAITLAETDGNDATRADAGWKPVLATPNHPEYPAAHSCTSGSLAETLRAYFGTADVTFTWDSTVTGTTRSYAGVDAFSAESGSARIFGGMHFSYATAAGDQLGRAVARRVAERHFQRR